MRRTRFDDWPCPIARTTDLIGDWWTPLIMREAFSGRRRFEEFQTALRAFKDRGYRVAVDDMGAGYSSFQALASIEPDFLKFDTSLVHDIDKSSIKQSLLETLRQLADKIKARVIAEGIEREEELQVLKKLGIELGQGFLFHRDDVEVK